MTTTGRKGRLFRRAEEDPEDRDADLSGDEHAWWAARETVVGVPRGPRTVVGVPRGPRTEEDVVPRGPRTEEDGVPHGPRTEEDGVPRGPRTEDGAPRGPRGPRAEEDGGEPKTDENHFSDHWTAESLYDDQAPSAPPDQGTEEADLDVPGGMDLGAAHLVLQIDIGADWEAITRAHRKLAMQFHPDRLVEHSTEAQELGRSRMAEINAAHATLRALHFH